MKLSAKDQNSNNKPQNQDTQESHSIKKSHEPNKTPPKNKESNEKS